MDEFLELGEEFEFGSSSLGGVFEFSLESGAHFDGVAEGLLVVSDLFGSLVNDGLLLNEAGLHLSAVVSEFDFGGLESGEDGVELGNGGLIDILSLGFDLDGVGLGVLEILEEILEESSDLGDIGGSELSGSELDNGGQNTGHRSSLSGLDELLEGESHMLGDLDEAGGTVGEFVNDGEGTLDGSDGWVEFILNQSLEILLFGLSGDGEVLEVGLDGGLVGSDLGEVSLSLSVGRFTSDEVSLSSSESILSIGNSELSGRNFVGTFLMLRIVELSVFEFLNSDISFNLSQVIQQQISWSLGLNSSLFLNSNAQNSNNQQTNKYQ